MKNSTYKIKIRKLIAKAKKLDSSLSYQSLATRIGVEPSYLSRFLGNTDVHFSDELLFKLLSEVKVDWAEIDMILVLKEFDRTNNPERKKFLLSRLRMGRVQRWRKGVDDIRSDLISIVSVLNEVNGARAA